MSERILIVDDDAPISRLLEQAFKDEGFMVTRAVDGMDAMNKLTNLRPEVIVMDIMMPRLDGIETTKLIARQPVRFLTGPAFGYTWMVYATTYTTSNAFGSLFIFIFLCFFMFF